MIEPLGFEDFAAQALWREHIRLSRFIGEGEGRKDFRKTLRRIRRGDLGIDTPNGWRELVLGWFRLAAARLAEGAD